MERKLVLISSFCDTEKKCEVLSKNISIIKSMGLDILLITPFNLPEKHIRLCDYVFITKDNHVLDWPQKAIIYWKQFFINNKMIKINKSVPDYGYAGLYQTKQLSEIALSLNYDYFYHIIYDLKFDEIVISGLNSTEAAKVYPSKRNDTVWSAGLHFMIFNKENLKKYADSITLESYLFNNNGDVHTWLNNLRYILPYNISDKPVEDEIYFFDDVDIFNSSPIPDINFFIEKNDQSLSNIKLFFYNTNNKKINIKIENTILNSEIKNDEIVDLGFNIYNIKNTSIIVGGLEFDVTADIVKIKHSSIEYYD